MVNINTVTIEKTMDFRALNIDENTEDKAIPKGTNSITFINMERYTSGW